MARFEPGKQFVVDLRTDGPSIHSRNISFDSELHEEFERGKGSRSNSFSSEQPLRDETVSQRGVRMSMQSNETASSSYSEEMETATSDEPKPVSCWYRWFLLKKRFIPPIPKERAISRETNANILSQISFQWANPLMSVGYNRTLELNDIWLLNPNRSVNNLTTTMSNSFYKRRTRGDKRPLIGAMYDTFKVEFILGGVCQLIAACIQVINPFVLRYLITFAQEAYYANKLSTPIPPIGRGIGLVIAITVMQIIQSSCTNQFLYRGMINGGQARAVLMAMIFDKAMKLSGRARARGKTLEDTADEHPANLKSGSKEEKMWIKKKLENSQTNKKALDDQGWSNGRIVNLMSTDTHRIDQASGMFHMTWTSPIQLIIALVLLLININYSALAGFGLLVIMTPILSKSIRILVTRRRRINKITDQRVSLMQETLYSVRFVKIFGWETSFLERISAIRKKEIRSIQFLLAIRNGINSISISMPIFSSMISFITYSLSHKSFNSALIFSSLALFNSLRIPLNLLPVVIGQVVDAVSSVARIEEFLFAEEVNDEINWDLNCKNAIKIEQATFTWERSRIHGVQKTVKESPRIGQLDFKKKVSKKPKNRQREANIDLSHLIGGSPYRNSKILASDKEKPFEIVNINLNIGRNELIAIIGGVGSGKSSLLAALAGNMRRTSGNITIGATRAFCPELAWIQNTSIKENVLFGKKMKSKWYNQVINACALRPDLDILPDGDLTEIGERGITISGGQKQRLNIARAIYSNSDIVLLDDPLSAVDAHVGHQIMDEAICGLLKDKCRILATHQLWVLNRCDRIIWIQDGRILTIDTLANLLGKSPEFSALIANNTQEEKKRKSSFNKQDTNPEQKRKHDSNRKPAVGLMQIEERRTKSVSWSVYGAYIRASGSMLVFPFISGLLILSQAANIMTSIWLSWWTDNKFNYSLGTYIGIYTTLGAAQAIFMFAFSVTLSVFGTKASKVMLNRAINGVLRAPISFFDTTPLGRITNRFSKDVDIMDNSLTEAIRFFFLTMGMIFSVFILIVAYFYYFAAVLGPLFLVFIFLVTFYRASARELKRHEAILRSIVFARFSEAIIGIPTIRAYSLEDRFSASLRSAIDDMNAAYFLTFANQRWLSARLDIISNTLVFTVGILIVTSRFSISPSTGGVVLSYLLSIVQMIQFTVRQLAEVENSMNSTERIHYYGTQLDTEPPLYKAPVSASWPDKGRIIFSHVDLRYRPGLPLVLRDITLDIAGGEHIGIVGRTGAGKSSILAALFRIVDPSRGIITIDGMNLSTIGLADLRSRLSIIPQEPTLFRGTVRSNLDPLGHYTDLELWSALRQADLVGEKPTFKHSQAGFMQASGGSGMRINLETAIEEGGLNFSLGQRQLMALARALVRDSQIIVCDEATSSIDMETDQRIQRTMKECFRGKTLLCIAHRLKTIIDYDRIVVMNAGAVAEVGSPLQLWERRGIFRGMCDRNSIGRECFEQERPRSFPELRGLRFSWVD